MVARRSGWSTRRAHLLDDVVAKHVGHERERPRQDLLKDELLLLGGGHLQLLLDEPTPVLVRTAQTTRVGPQKMRKGGEKKVKCVQRVSGHALGECKEAFPNNLVGEFWVGAVGKMQY